MECQQYGIAGTLIVSKARVCFEVWTTSVELSRQIRPYIHNPKSSGGVQPNLIKPNLIKPNLIKPNLIKHNLIERNLTYPVMNLVQSVKISSHTCADVTLRPV